MGKALKKLMTNAYQHLLIVKHKRRPWGGTGHRWATYAASMAIDLQDTLEQPVTVLDYGCGRGTFKPAMTKEFPHAEVFEYDPGIPEKMELPRKEFDIVVCTDVMEHVEPSYLDATIAHLGQIATHGLFFNISLRLAGSSLPDGRNTHLIVQPADWWMEQLKKHLDGWVSMVHSSVDDELTVEFRR